jgi:two-component system phosphate regulon sensor histidine kinase PhoR
MKVYRLFSVAAIFALCILLIIQVYWFSNAYKLEEKQFDETVNLSLRSVANNILEHNGDSDSKIAPVLQTASNSFFVEINSFIQYQLLDSLLKSTFSAQNLHAPFNLSIYNVKDDGLILGNIYSDWRREALSTTCVGRYHEHAEMNFAVTFPSKKTDILGAVNVWVFSSGTFLLILVFFGFILIDLHRQKKLAQIKNSFINNMTHELQTPIANISIASEVLRANNSLTSEKRTKYLGIIHQENQRLKHNVDQVLQAALIDRKGLMLANNEVNIHELIEEVINNFQVRIQSRTGSLKSFLKQKLVPF